MGRRNNLSRFSGKFIQALANYFLPSHFLFINNNPFLQTAVRTTQGRTSRCDDLLSWSFFAISGAGPSRSFE